MQSLSLSGGAWYLYGYVVMQIRKIEQYILLVELFKDEIGRITVMMGNDKICNIIVSDYMFNKMNMLWHIVYVITFLFVLVSISYFV